MGAVAIICGGEKVVEPERAAAGPEDKYCYSYDNNTTPAAPVSSHVAAFSSKKKRKKKKPRLQPSPAARCELKAWRGEEEESDGADIKDPPRGSTECGRTAAITTAAAPQTALTSKYQSLGVLGRGRYSQVTRVQDSTTGLHYALKAVQKNGRGRGSDSSLGGGGNSWQAEVEALTRCGAHPNIVSLHAVFHSPEKTSLLLELASGGDLFDRVSAKGHFDEALGRDTLRMIAGGVAYLHRSGIVHRDLKLENLLYKNCRDDSPILITDFGLAHVVPVEGHGSGRGCGDQTSVVGMSTTCGSPEYMSPEMLQGEEYGCAVDVWALGVVAYAVLGGAMPFQEAPERGGRAKMYRDIMAGQYTFSDQVHVCAVRITVEPVLTAT